MLALLKKINRFLYQLPLQVYPTGYGLQPAAVCEGRGLKLQYYPGGHHPSVRSIMLRLGRSTLISPKAL